jgi:hypothetical protein
VQPASVAAPPQQGCTQSSPVPHVRAPHGTPPVPDAGGLHGPSARASDAQTSPSQHQTSALVQVQRRLGAVDPGGGSMVHVVPWAGQAPVQLCPTLWQIPPLESPTHWAPEQHFARLAPSQGWPIPAHCPPPPAPPVPDPQFPSQHQLPALVHWQTMLGASDPGGGLIVHVDPGAQLPEQALPPPAAPPLPLVVPSLLHAGSRPALSNTKTAALRAKRRILFTVPPIGSDSSRPDCSWRQNTYDCVCVRGACQSTTTAGGTGT